MLGLQAKKNLKNPKVSIRKSFVSERERSFAFGQNHPYDHRFAPLNLHPFLSPVLTFLYHLWQNKGRAFALGSPGDKERQLLAHHDHHHHQLKAQQSLPRPPPPPLPPPPPHQFKDHLLDLQGRPHHRAPLHKLKHHPSPNHLHRQLKALDPADPE